MAHPELAPVSFISMVLVLIPLPWHLRARNVATVSTMLWLAFGNLYHFINALLWKGNVVVRAEVYCDIALSLFNASAFALPAAAVCVTRHLESVSSPNYSPSGLNDKRHRFIFEIVMCLILPIVYSAAHLIVQGHRFDIIEDLGCVTTTYMSWPAVFLYYFPCLVLAFATTIYASMSLRWFIQRRAQFRDLFPSSSGLNTSRYFRLMALAITEILGTVVINLYVVITASQHAGIQSWVSWQFVHADFKRIGQYPAVVMPQSTMRTILGIWSIIPISSGLFFVFFAFGEEATSEYRKHWRWICRVILRRDPESWQSTRNGSLPSFVERKGKTSDDGHKVEMSGSLSSRGASAKWHKDDDSLFGDRLDAEAAKDVSPSYSSFESRSMSPRPYAHPLHGHSEPEPILISVAISRSTHVSGPPSFIESEKEGSSPSF